MRIDVREFVIHTREFPAEPWRKSGIVKQSQQLSRRDNTTLYTAFDFTGKQARLRVRDDDNNNHNNNAADVTSQVSLSRLLFHRRIDYSPSAPRLALKTPLVKEISGLKTACCTQLVNAGYAWIHKADPSRGNRYSLKSAWISKNRFLPLAAPLLRGNFPLSLRKRLRTFDVPRDQKPDRWSRHLAIKKEMARQQPFNLSRDLDPTRRRAREDGAAGRISRNLAGKGAAISCIRKNFATQLLPLFLSLFCHLVPFFALSPERERGKRKRLRIEK